MKNKIIYFSTISAIAITTLMSCNQTTSKQTEKVEDAKQELTEAKEQVNEATANKEIAEQNLAQAKVDSTYDYKTYKVYIEKQLLINENEIARLKVKMDADKQENRAANKAKLDEMNARNKMLRTKIEAYKETTKEKWVQFKLDFNREMNDLGLSISDLSKKNIDKINSK